MANFYVTHHKFPRNPQLFTVALHKVVHRGGENNPNFTPKYSSAEPYWKVFIHTTGFDFLGESVGPVVADVRGAEVTVNEFVNNKVSQLCGLIDWSQQGQFTPEIDSNAPVVIEQFPKPNQIDVPISSPIVIRVQDLLPGTGIDPSTVSMKVDGISVSPTVVGNKYDYSFSFRPKPIFAS